MALDAAALKSELMPDIEDKIRFYILDGDNTSYPQLTEFCEAMATSIANKVVAHIVANAELNDAKFSGTFNGSADTTSCSITITDHPVTGGVV